MNTSRKLRFLSYAIVVYMLLAFSWWSVLLTTKNRDAFNAKTEILRLQYVVEGRYIDEESFQSSPGFQQMKADYETQELMIYGEAFVILVGIIIGIFMINRGYGTLVRNERAKRNFLLSISHELKSPIASIRLALETMRKRPDDNNFVSQISDQALEEADRLHGLVNNLLLAVKMETGYQPSPDTYELSNVLEYPVKSMRSLYPGATIELYLDLEHELFEVDKTAMQSVLTNLIENGIKYSSDKARIIVDITEKSNEIQMIVKDHGQGIPEDEKQKIFEKFYRLGNEETRKTKGTGLGLYIVKKMVEANGGTIRVRDNVPNGTIFDVHWPVKYNVNEHAHISS